MVKFNLLYWKDGKTSLTKSFLKIKICLKEKGKVCKQEGTGNNKQLETGNIQKEVWKKLVY